MWLLWGFPELFTSIRCSMALCLWRVPHFISILHIGPSPRNLARTWGFPELFTSIRCSVALVFVESVAFRIDFAHRAIPLKPSVCLRMANL